MSEDLKNKRIEQKKKIFKHSKVQNDLVNRKKRKGVNNRAQNESCT